MNGDEDLGQDITMKGEKFHYNQEPELLGLDGFAYKSNQKKDIRGPTTDGPTAGVYQWPVPAPEMAPLPGPHPKQAKAGALAQKKVKEDNLEADEGKIQMMAGPEKLGKYSVGKGFHDLTMNPGRNYPDENRDRMGETNNMWHYPATLGDGPIKAHIPPPETGKVVDAEAEQSGLDSWAKKLEKKAKEAKKLETKNAKENSLVQKNTKEINSTPEKLQSVAGENVLGKGYIGESVHTAAMWSGYANPA